MTKFSAFGFALIGILATTVVAEEELLGGCPTEKPLDFSSCLNDVALFDSCSYGEVVCDDQTFSTDECECSPFGYFCLRTSACPVPCPPEKPMEGMACSGQFVDVSCPYGGELCCGEECVVQEECYCNFADTIVCQMGPNLVCPEVCPLNPPSDGDPCNIDFQFDCDYGELVCEDEIFAPFEKSCYCDDSTQVFLCFEPSCPVSCPEDKPVIGEECKEFTGNGLCPYGGELCCGEECVVQEECYCESFLNDTTIYCDNGPSLPCPEVCPLNVPSDGDPCNIDSQFDCGYGDEISCDNFFDSAPFETKCVCNEFTSTFTCRKNEACPVPCPDEILVDGADCSAEFITFTCPNNGEVCCGERCVPNETCFCLLGLIGCFGGPPIACPEECPMTPPKEGSSCNIDEQLKCEYGDPVVCTSFTHSSSVDCFCDGGTFSCFENECFDASPVMSPVMPPVTPPNTLPTDDSSSDYGMGMTSGSMGMTSGSMGMMSGSLDSGSKKKDKKRSEIDYGERRRLRGE